MTKSQLANYTAVSLIVITLLFAIYSKQTPKKKIQREIKNIENII